MIGLAAINLDGFDPPLGCGEYCWGPPVDYPDSSQFQGRWKDHQYHAEVLGWAYHDYMGNHAYAQVWDYAEQDNPKQTWQYMLLLHRPYHERNEDGAITGGTWGWVIARNYDHRYFEGPPPSYAEVGAAIDGWLTESNEGP